MEQQTILEGYGEAEKTAYLSAIASLATADRQASEEEIEYLRELCTAAQLSPQQTQTVEQAATEVEGAELTRSLDVLKNSELRYSLVTDLIAFAKADNDYSEEEQGSVGRISKYLGVNQEQFGLLNQVAEKAAEDPQALQEPAAAQNFFGFGDKMRSAGINSGGLFKSLLSIAAPMLIGGMISRGLGGRRGGGGLGGMLGGGLGGMLGGRGGLGGGGLGGMMGGGGLGSLIGMLSGGRGMGSTGGLLGRMLGGRGF